MREDSLDLLRHDLSSQARMITGVIEQISTTNSALQELKTDKAVREERNKNLDDRLDRIEKSVENLQSIGKWIIVAFAAAFITAVASFIIKGGLNIN